MEGIYTGFVRKEAGKQVVVYHILQCRIEGNFVSQDFRFLLPNWLGCHSFFSIMRFMSFLSKVYLFRILVDANAVGGPP
jgi:hypothetical protein